MKLTGNRCRCGACNQYFRSVSAFDMHRTGSHAQLARRCLTTDEMTEAGMSKDQHGCWMGPSRSAYELSSRDLSKPMVREGV